MCTLLNLPLNMLNMKNNDPLQTLQLKLDLVAGGQQVTLTRREADLYGAQEADLLTEQIEQEVDDGE
jgi:hypothetical protein